MPPVSLFFPEKQKNDLCTSAEVISVSGGSGMAEGELHSQTYWGYSTSFPHKCQQEIPTRFYPPFSSISVDTDGSFCYN